MLGFFHFCVRKAPQAIKVRATQGELDFVTIAEEFPLLYSTLHVFFVFSALTQRILESPVEFYFNILSRVSKDTLFV